MASTGKCPYCGSTVRSDEQTCPHCGAANENYVADMPRTVFLPKTIEELKEYCAERGMPLLRMRFFIGEDYRPPKAFGIYRDGDDVVVYKNKADGTRAIRYRGPDEAHAVNEIFQKLLEECHNRGIYPDGAPTRSSSGSRGGSRSSSGSNAASLLLLVLVWAMLMAIPAMIQSCTHRRDGYYGTGNGTVYYHYGGDWYYTTDETASGYWYETSSFPESNYENYSMGDSWRSDWGVSNFKNSSTWDSIVESNSSDSSDYDSWDSGDTDWDSDW